MEYEHTLTYSTIERFSCRTTLECRKRVLELTIEEDSPTNMKKELAHVNETLAKIYERDKARAEKICNQEGISGKP